MAKIHRILIPVDFSDVSKQALAYGISVATAFHADLVSASIIEDEPAFVPDSRGSTPERRQSFTEVQAKLEGLIPENVRSALNYHCIVKTGDIEDELLSAVADNQVGLIIMGTHGRRAFKRWLLGSVTAKILRRVFVPIITLSHRESEVAPSLLSNRSVLYATDLSFRSERGLSLAYDFARAFDSKLTLVHVIAPWSGIMSGRSERDHARARSRVLKRMEESIPGPIRLDPRVRAELREGSPYSAVLKLADEEDVGLIVVNLQGEHRLEPPLLGSTAERVIRGSHRPVLSLPSV